MIKTMQWEKRRTPEMRRHMLDFGRLSFKSVRDSYVEISQSREKAFSVLSLLAILAALQFVHHKFFMNGSMIWWHVTAGLLNVIPLLIAVVLYLAWRRTAEKEKESRLQIQSLEAHREDLTHMLVHDLKNPLTAALAGLGFVLGQEKVLEQLGDAEKKALNIARKSQMQLSRMIEDILDVSQAEAGEMPLDLQLIGLTGIIESVVEELGARSRSKDLRIKVDFQDKAQVRADQEKIRRVVGNLIDNAIKHTPRGGRIVITGEISDIAACVTVRDTGEGIPEELRERIFDKFVQSNAAKKGRRMSVGLGLAFCKLALEAHGGSIWVESNQDKGSTFTFTLPRN